MVAKKFLPKGHIFTKNDVSTKKPGTGLSSDYLKKILNKKTLKEYQKDQFFKLKDLK